MQDAKGPGSQKAEKSKTAHKKERSIQVLKNVLATINFNNGNGTNNLFHKITIKIFFLYEFGRDS